MPAVARRRHFLLGSAALLAAAGLSRLPFAQTFKAGAVPTVDALTVKVITDSYYDTPRTGTSKWVKVSRAPTTYARDVRRTLHSEWGLALALESRRGSETRNILLDFGYTPEALLNNMEILGIDAS